MHQRYVYPILLTCLLCWLCLTALPSLAADGTLPTAAPDIVLYLPLINGGPADVAPTATPSPTSTATDPAPTPMPTATATTTTTPGDLSPIAATVGISVSQQLQLDTSVLRLGGVSAIFYASQTANTGGIVTTGTLTVIGQNQFTYAPDPTDRLHLILPDGRTMDIYAATITGSDGSSPQNYLNGTHHFAARIVTGAPVASPDPNITLPPNADLNLLSIRANGQDTLTVAGGFDFAGAAHTANISSQGTYYFDSSGGGLEYRTAYTVTGTIEGPTLSATVAESYRNEIVTVSGHSVSTADTSLNTSWSYGGERYAIQHGLIRRSFEEGFVNESEIDSYWYAGGQLLHNDRGVGNLALNLHPIYLEVIVQLGEESYLYQRFRRPTTIEPTVANNTPVLIQK